MGTGNDRAALGKANDTIRCNSELISILVFLCPLSPDLLVAEKLSCLVTSLKEQQDELYKLLASSAECEAKLHTSQQRYAVLTPLTSASLQHYVSRVTELQDLVSLKDVELQSLQTVQHE